jgi:hypothetical protein
MQSAVGGRIEIIPLEREGLEDLLLVVHEEGKLISLPLNYPRYNRMDTLLW